MPNRKASAWNKPFVVRRADRDRRSRRPVSNHPIAYEALLQVGIVALRAHDLRTDSRGGHHTLALQTLVTTIGAPSAKIRLLDEFRRQRAASLYDGSFIPTQAELAELIGNVQQLYALLLDWLKANRPALVP